MTCGQQQEDARRSLFDSCMNSILPTQKDHFIDLVYHRLDIYGGIFNQTKNSGGDWADYKLQCNDWLINAMLYSNNDYKKMTTEAMPLVIQGFMEQSSIKMATASLESTLLIMFDSCLKHVFENNSDFRLLPTKELLSRISAGHKKGKSIIDRNKSVPVGKNQQAKIKLLKGEK